MSDYTGFREIGVNLDALVATVEIRRPPHNFFDSALIAEIGEAFERLDADPACRTIVLAAEGRSFCAGADFSKRLDTGTVQEAARSGAGRHLYKEAIRLYESLGIVPANMYSAYFEDAFKAAGLQVRSSDPIGSEWLEYSEEQQARSSKELLHIARMRRLKGRIVAEFGQEAYDVILAVDLWHLYLLIGKLSSTIYTLRKSS